MLEFLKDLKHFFGGIIIPSAKNIYTDNLNMYFSPHHIRKAIPKCIPITPVIVGKIQSFFYNLMNFPVSFHIRKIYYIRISILIHISTIPFL